MLLEISSTSLIDNPTTQVLMGHVTGNINSRQAAKAFNQEGTLYAFHTSIAWRKRWKRVERLLPKGLVQTLGKRSFPEIPDQLLQHHPTLEILRLTIPKVLRRLRPSVEEVNRHFDIQMAKAVKLLPSGSTVYGYFDTSLETFRIARDKGIRTVYELPTTYWRKIREIIKGHSKRFPKWELTHPELNEASIVAHRRDQELQLADVVIVPSNFVRESLNLAPTFSSRVEVVPYGCPQSSLLAVQAGGNSPATPLKALFVGSLAADKGLPELLDAADSLGPQINLTVIGSSEGSSSSSPTNLRQQLSNHRFLGKLSHHQVLDEMSRHDVLVLPSYYEGLALVILEAMSSGLTVIVTPNSGSGDFVQNGKQGFIVPAGSVHEVCASLFKLISDRDLLLRMREQAHAASQCWTWGDYRRRLVQAVG